MIAPFIEWVELARALDKRAAVAPREELLESAKAFVRAGREAIRARHDAGESGGSIVKALSDHADALVTGVIELGLARVKKPAKLAKRISLVAQGGYGRAHLNPGSDLDICLLYDGWSDKDLDALNQFAVPFLWDTGYEISFVSRGVKETIQLARHDMKVFTTSIECRLLFGAPGPFARMALAMRGMRAPAHFAELELRERSEPTGGDRAALYAVEPNIKDGDGGLRDYQTALWLFAATQGTATLDDLVNHSMMPPEERLELEEALDFMWRVRNELHFCAGRKEDRLSHANQLRVARAFGYTGEDSHDTARFMEDYYASARKLRRFLRMAARACHYAGAAKLLDTPRPGGHELTVEDGELYAGVGDPHWFEENPARLMSVFWECARRGVILSHPTERFVRDNLRLAGDTFQTSDLVRRFFLAICNRPLAAGHALRQAAETGLLARYMPEFAAVQNVIRYEEFHHYPVDEHTLLAIDALAKVPALGGAIGNCLNKALEHLSDPYILVLSLLCHDLGKAGGELHVEEGVRLVHDLGKRMGLPEDDIERVAFLVQHHMAMTHIALYRDTDDMDIVQAFAQTMKSSERLRALFLLSYCDMSAVAPNVWNDWKGALLMKLYLRAETVLTGRTEARGDDVWLLPKAEEVRLLVPEELRAGVEDLLRALGERYFLAFSAGGIASHLDCLREAEAQGVAVRSQANAESGLTEIVVCTRDRSGLFSEIAGCFASQLIDVKNAALFTRPDGMALDCFTVVNAAQGTALTPAQAAGIDRVLRSVLSGEKTVEEYLEPSRKRIFALFQPAVPVPTRVTFDNDASRTHTVVDIEGGDRTGLLYDVSRTMTRHGLDIASARIVTDARRVRDSFYVTLDRMKLEDKPLQAEIVEALKEAIHPRPVAQTIGEVS